MSQGPVGTNAMARAEFSRPYGTKRWVKIRVAKEALRRAHTRGASQADADGSY